MAVDKLLYAVVVFVAGFIAALLWVFYSGAGITGSAVSVPSDFVSGRDIFVYPGEVVIKIEGAKVTNYDSTGSMNPVFGEGVNGIVVKPLSVDEINVGDIVSFYSGGELVVHRVVEVGEDEEGVYFITKGDSNGFSDGKVRFGEIEHRVVGLVY